MSRQPDLRIASNEVPGPYRRPRRRQAARVLVVAIVALAFGLGSNAALAIPDGGRPAIGDVRVFASVPAPGHPFGIAVEGDRVYVSTSAGDFFADPENGGHKNSDDERIFTYDDDGNLLDTTIIDTMDEATMGLFGIALDGNPKPRHKLYVADMNGFIWRVDLSQHPAAPELFSQVPADTGLAGDWMLAMWNDLVFDPAGNLYVPDDKPRIWRVTPDGTASIWFTDPRLTGLFGIAGGPLGGRIDPTGEWLYFSITGPGVPGRGGDLPGSTGRCSYSRGPRARPSVPVRTPAGAAGVGHRLRQVGQSLRQPARHQPDRGPRPGR